MATTISDNENQTRFELWLDGELAGFLQYRRHPTVITLVHTEIFPPLEGRGLASQLISSVLDTAREQGLEVLPVCPFVQDLIRKHPDYLDLVPDARREQFELADDAE
jgi:predicted GNAT family acetyltransferase